MALSVRPCQPVTTTTMLDGDEKHGAECDEFPEFSEAIMAELDDDVYKLLESVLVAEGRGRRPSLPSPGSLNCSQQLLLQVDILRKWEHLSWSSVCDLMARLFPSYPRNRFRPLIEKTALSFVDCSGTLSKRQDFYKVAIDLDCVGPHATKAGLGRSALLEATRLGQAVTVTNGLAVEIELFRRRENLPKDWLHLLQDCTSPATPISAIMQLMVNYRAVQRHKGKKFGKENYDRFMNAAFSPTIASDTSHSQAYSRLRTTVTVSASLPASTAGGPTSVLAVSSPLSTGTGNLQSTGKDISESTNMVSESSAMASNIPPQREITINHVIGIKNKSLAGQVETLQGVNKELTKQNTNLIELSKEKSKEHCQVVDCLAKEQTKTMKLEMQLSERKKEVRNLQAEISDCKKELSEIRHSNFYKRLVRKEKKLDASQDIIDQHMHGCEHKITELKRQLKNMQTKVSNLNTTLDSFKQERACLVQEVKQLKQECTELASQMKIEVETKDGCKFTDDVVKCIIELIGEAEVPAEKCAKVIKIVQVVHVDMYTCPCVPAPPPLV